MCGSRWSGTAAIRTRYAPFYKNMLKTKYISNCTKLDIDEIKIASLYFDQIDIINNSLFKTERLLDEEQTEEYPIVRIKGKISLVTDEYNKHIEVLIRENIVSVVSEHNKNKDVLLSKVDEIAKNLIASYQEFIFKVTKMESNENIVDIDIPEEARRIHEEFVGSFAVGSEINLKFIKLYYGSLLSSFLLHISNGYQCLTSSKILNDFLQMYLKDEEILNFKKEAQGNEVAPCLIFNALKLAVPNISYFPFEEVLETRERAKSELLAFRNELETFQFNLKENYSYNEINFRSSEIVKYKLEPSLRDLQRKISDINYSLPSTLLDKFKDPSTYIPLIGTILVGIPQYISAMLSVGLISASSLLDYVQKRREISRNGLYYLISLDNKFNKKNGA